MCHYWNKPHYSATPTHFPKSQQKSTQPYPRNRKKPQWVTDKVLYLYAISGLGCGTVADIFNQRYRHKNESVSKTFVYNKVRENKHRIHTMRRNIKAKPPRGIKVNHTWGVDLTTVTFNQQQKTILGIIDHGSRVNLNLSETHSKHSARIIREILQTIRQFGFPRAIRTDNEACFTSWWFKLSLKLLGIKHQTTHIASPWQNGRIERFFGTFKNTFKQINWDNHPNHLQDELSKFQIWYNCIRPHQNIGGLTPKEAFTNKRNKGKPKWVSDWGGLLTGYYFPD